LTRYNGDYHVCDICVCLNAHKEKAYHLGVGSPTSTPRAIDRRRLPDIRHTLYWNLAVIFSKIFTPQNAVTINLL
jgi:hypothetical protein